jgi:hypothetical protein
MSKILVNRSTRAKVALVPVLSLGMFGGFLALAAPANAETSRYGCTVDPLDPEDLRGDKVDFSIKVDCNGEKTVEIRQWIYEDERGHHHDDRLAERTVSVDFDRHDDATTIHCYVDFGDDHGRHDYAINKHDDCEDLEMDDRKHDRKVEEVYQLVSFRVQNHGGHWSDWTDGEKSAVVEVDHHGH